MGPCLDAAGKLMAVEKRAGTDFERTAEYGKIR